MNLYQFLKSKNYHSGLDQILVDIAYGSIEVYQKINEEGGDIFGGIGDKNIQNEDVQKLDLIANDIFINRFKINTCINAVLSEENEDVINIDNSKDYLIAMDPLDGSSNIDVNIPIGSIFSVLKNHPNHFLQKGEAQQLACYVIYGTSTMMVFSIEDEVFGFTLNTKTKEYLLTHPNIQTPNTGSIFSINEGNFNSIESGVMKYVNYCKELNSDGNRTHTGRFVGSLVADFHRNMLKGGIFMYPKTADKPEGQLRLIYECNPIAFIAKNANGQATSLEDDILNITPLSVHQRTSFVVGSKKMVDKLLSFCN